MEQKDEDIIDHLEEEPPNEDFKTKIEDIYHNLPVSIQDEYKNRLRKKDLENDFETEASYNVLSRLNDAYMRKRERSKITSQNKRDKLKAIKNVLNVETKKRGRPKLEPSKPKIVAQPKAEPKSEPKAEPEPTIEPLQFDLSDNEDGSDDDSAEEINELLKDIKIEEPQPKSQPKKEMILPPPKLVRSSLAGLFC